MTIISKGDPFWMSWCIQNGIEWTEGPCINKDAMKQPYVSLVCGGVKLESSAFPLYTNTLEMALDFYNESLLEWLAGRKFIVWRHYPEWERTPVIKESNGENWFQVYSRLTAYQKKADYT